MHRALEEPLRQLAENAGLEGSVVVNDVRKAKKGHGLNAADKVKESLLDSLDGDEKTGATIVLRSLEEPLRQLATNAGLEGSVVIQSVRSAKPGQGLNVDSGEVEDLVKSGIIDPTMVTRSALQNAASIGKNILTTEAIVTDAPEKTPAGAGAGMPDMSGMM